MVILYMMDESGQSPCGSEFVLTAGDNIDVIYWNTVTNTGCLAGMEAK